MNYYDITISGYIDIPTAR